MKSILNIGDLAYTAWEHGEKFGSKYAEVGTKIGARKLGYNITVVPPGKRSCPFHSHRVNEEMFFVLEGSGEVRIGPDTFPIRQGDFIACPPGGPETAHHIVNSSDADIKYLAVSTMEWPELGEYPDSGRYAAIGLFTNAEGETEEMRFVMKRQAEFKDFWEGEG
jgi:uncharacterized cupin superfamily protein